MMNSKSSKSLNFIFSLLFFILLNSFSTYAQSVEEGEKLYKANCTACHMIDKKLIGPALEGVNDKYSEEWLIKWIKNSAEMIASGDPQAVAIYEEYNKSPMTSFLHFSDEDVVNILAYIEAAPSMVEAVSASSAGGSISVIEDNTTDYILLTFFLTLLLLIAGLWKIKKYAKNCC